MTTPTEPANRVPAGIDVPAVTAWYGAHVPDAVAPLHFERVAGGHSCLTYVVTGADGARTVLRRPPIGHVLATAHDVAREHRIMDALRDTGVPVPRMIGLCTDPSVNEAPFYVMQHVAGPVLHTVHDAEAMPDDATRRRAGESLVDALVALHAVDPDEVGLGDLSKRTGYVERQLRRWSQQWEGSKSRDVPGMEQMHAWLLTHQPPDSPPRVAHGDFRLGNCIHAPDGSVVAMLDWELCALGEPLADVSYLLRSWGETSPSGDRATSAASGFPTRDEVIARYEAGSGRPLDNLTFWTVFHSFRSAAIVDGVYRRYIDGKMANAEEDPSRYAAQVDALVAVGMAAAGLG
jgi:aminoglycoside phosphotransferase (APT) family kinase protein